MVESGYLSVDEEGLLMEVRKDLEKKEICE